jgi:hypothetical protein
MRGKALAVLALAALLTPLAALPAHSAPPRCFGEEATVPVVPGVPTVGTDGDDVIIGTDGPDNIRGGKGRDRICGLGGNDVLRGGGGRDRISGGAGDDYIEGGTGLQHTLIGGPGNDHLQAEGDRDRVSGNGGADYLSTYSAQNTTASGGSANDSITTGDWTTLDAGAGVDRCELSNGVIPVNCEELRLLCGVGGIPLPADVASLPGLTSATGAFDGDPNEDTLYVWRDPGLGWIIHVELDNGYGIQELLGAPAEHLAALGGYDINGDGIDEIFAQVGSNPRRVVGIAMVYLTLSGLPRNCILEGIQWGSGSTATFPIGTDAALTNGLACRGGEHTIRQFVQQPWPGGTYLQHRYDYSYAPNFGVDNPVFDTVADSHPVFDPAVPAQAAILQRGGEFHCGGLALP